MRKHRVSVVIPAFNAERFLADAINSALAQTHAADEILVIDDGSTDATSEVAESFGERITLLKQGNFGVAAARNRGIRAGRGEWLAFLDADDLMLPDRLAVQQNRLAIRPQAKIAFGAQCLFSGEPPREGAAISAKATPAMIPSTLYCHRSVFDRVGLFDVGQSGPEFISWFAEVQRVGIPYVSFGRAVALRRIHENNLSRRQTRTGEYTQMVKMMLDRRRAA